jgi:hypothetical protein
MSWFDSWINNFDRRRGAPPFIQISNKKILIIITTSLTDHDLAFCNYLKSGGFINQNIDIYVTTVEDESNYSLFIQKKWKQGYNVFIGTEGSTLLSSIFDFLILHKNDIMYFNTRSTVTFEGLPLPPNLIRTSQTDKLGIEYCFQHVYPQYNFMFNNTLFKNSNLKEKLDENNDMPFKTIVYIYEPDLYTTSFLNDMISYIERAPKLYSVQFIPILIQPDEPLNDLSKYLLTYNTIGEIANGTNPLFILNTSDPLRLLSKFDNEKYYDNFFILTDGFGSFDYNTIYQFKYTYLFIANHSELGYKLAGNIGLQDILSLQVLNIYNICYQIGPLFNKYIQFGNNNNIRFNSSNFINILKDYKYIIDGLWFDKYVVCEKIYTTSDNILKHAPSVVNHKWNPENTSFADDVFDYNDLANTTAQKYTYTDNLNNILSNKSANLLTGEYDVLMNDTDYDNFCNVYITYGTYDLARIDFQKYYTFNNLPKITYPVIKININITQNVADTIFNNDQNITYDIPVIIPSLTFTKNILSRDVGFTSRIRVSSPSVTIPSKTITIDNCFDSFIVLYYNEGNGYKEYSRSTVTLGLPNFNENYLIFQYTQFVSIYVTMTWNVIKEVVIGDECYYRDPTDLTNILIDANGNSTLYYVRTIVDANTVRISTTNSGTGTITKIKNELYFLKDLPSPP